VDGYHHFAKEALIERKNAHLPPFTFLTLVRAEANRSDWVEEFLRQVRHILEAHHFFNVGCQILGPTPAPVAKKAGKYRWHLLVQAQKRSIMQQLLREVSSDLLPIALKGASEEVREKILRNMSKRAREMLVDDMDARGPIKIREGEQAQKEILTIARSLADSGQIDLGRGGDDYI